MAIARGKWDSTEATDMRGRELRIGDKVVRAYTSGRATNIEVVEVTDIRNGNVYLDGSSRPINFPGRVLIVSELYP